MPSSGILTVSVCTHGLEVVHDLNGNILFLVLSIAMWGVGLCAVVLRVRKGLWLGFLGQLINSSVLPGTHNQEF